MVIDDREYQEHIILLGLKMSEEYRGIYEWDASPEPKPAEVWNWRPGSPGGQVCLGQSEASVQANRKLLFRGVG